MPRLWLINNQGFSIYGHEGAVATLKPDRAEAVRTRGVKNEKMSLFLRPRSRRCERHDRSDRSKYFAKNQRLAFWLHSPAIAGTMEPSHSIAMTIKKY